MSQHLSQHWFGLLARASILSPLLAPCSRLAQILRALLSWQCLFASSPKVSERMGLSGDFLHCGSLQLKMHSCMSGLSQTCDQRKYHLRSTFTRGQPWTRRHESCGLGLYHTLNTQSWILEIREESSFEARITGRWQGSAAHQTLTSLVQPLAEVWSRWHGDMRALRSV
jgi:hypothetical protein